MCATAYFDGKFMPIEDIHIGIQTHALHYGTACFEGIRAYWNSEEQQLFGFRFCEHYKRLENSAKTILMKLPASPEELADITVELLARDHVQGDVYIRPLLFKNSDSFGLKMIGVPESFVIYWLPLNKYLNTDDGIRATVSTWRRISDSAIPARAKITGAYINSALAKAEANLNGFDEAILLTEDGHVAEGSGENIFLLSGGRLITPDLSQDILPGITRDAVIRIAREELGMTTIERHVDRTELYSADEVFMTGTAAEVTPLLEIDHRTIGSGGIGPMTAKLQKAFFQTVRGQNSSYSEWLRPIYTKAPVSAS